MDCQIKVLTTGFWPTQSAQQQSEFKGPLPDVFKVQQERFLSFYADKYQGRRLSWEYGLGRCIVSAFFSKGRKELDVSFYQVMTIMMMEIMRMTKMIMLFMTTCMAINMRTMANMIL